MEPICRIRLPSHHPAVKDLKKGERVTLEAEKAEEAMEPIGLRDEKGERPPPLETPFHVTGITKARAKSAPAPKVKTSPVDYLKSKRSTAPAGESAESMT